MSRSTFPRWQLTIAGALALVAALVVGGLLVGPLLRGSSPVVALGAARFVEETRASGIDHVYDGDLTYAVGGGVAAFDCAGDGRQSLYLAGGRNPAALYRNDSPVGGALRFTRVASPITDLTGVLGAYPIDLDGDGVADLVVLRASGNLFLRGLGACRFERANERFGYDGGAAVTAAFSATWEGASLPTLAFGNYVDPSRDDPRQLCFDNVLVRPDASGTRYASAIPLRPSWCALSMLFSDWSRSGHQDLRVSNDSHYYLAADGEEQLWRVRAGEAPRLYTADEGWVRVQIQGMGIASYDLSGTGYPDVFLTSQGDNKLQTLAAGPGQPRYRDMGLRRGANAARPFTGGDIRPSTAWHAEFADVNNDGLPDLFIAKGNVTTDPDFAQKDPSNLLIGRADGTFRETAEDAGIVSFDRARGAVLADLNLSGLLDLVVVNYGAPVRVWRNVGSGDAAASKPMGNWLAVRITQPGPNIDAIGAWVEVRTGDRVQRRELTVGGGHASGELGWVHVGLGNASDARLRVLWPDGEAGPWMSAPSNAFGLVTRGANTIRRWSPGA